MSDDAKQAARRMMRRADALETPEGRVLYGLSVAAACQVMVEAFKLTKEQACIVVMRKAQIKHLDMTSRMIATMALRGDGRWL